MAKNNARIIDPLNSPSYGLRGRIVTMTTERDILEDAIIFIDKAVICDIVKKGEPIPDDLKKFPVYDTAGTIYPGLIELHNHLSYNCLPMWNVPKKYGNRGQWAGIPQYQQLISGPMNILGKTPGFVEAIVRYVECKCLVAGVTTSQGIMLFSNAGIKKYYRGIVRNVEDTEEPLLPNVSGHIPDIASKDAEHFLAQLKKSSCLLLHLSEGVDKSAHKHFDDLKINDESWAITSALTGIHCVALTEEDFDLMAEKGASMIWSPMSNLMLYGGTANVKAAKTSGIKIGIGSDWSPSGSKNLLGELKVAKLYSDNNGNIFSDYELLCMATTNAAKIIKWDKRLGTIEKEKLADLVIVNGDDKGPFTQILKAGEKDISLVVINGTPRYGSKPLMSKFGKGTESRQIGTAKKTFNLGQDTADPTVSKLSLADAEKKLSKALANLNAIKKKMPKLVPVTTTGNQKIFVPQSLKAEKNQQSPSWVLVLDHDEQEGPSIRPHLATKKKSLSKIEKSISKTIVKEFPKIVLDPLTVSDDNAFFSNIDNEMNLPDYVKNSLRSMYT